MANIIETHDSRKGSESADKKEHTLKFLVWEVSDEDEAWAVFLTTKPSMYRGLPFRSGTIDPQGCMTFFFEAEYGDGSKDDQKKDEPKEDGDSTFTFETTGGTEHITVSRGTAVFNKAGAPPAPQFNHAIQVSQSGPEGVDIIVPKFSFTMQKMFDLSVFTPAYLQKIREMTGTVNRFIVILEATMTGLVLSFNPGELLFNGITDGKEKKDGLIMCSFSFSANDNLAENLTIGDITVTEKAGWDYLWVLFDETISNNFKVRTPRAAYVEQVYRRANHNELGL